MKIDFDHYKAVIFDFDGTLYKPNKLGLKLVLSDLSNALKAKKERKARKALAGYDCGSASALYAKFFNILGERNRDWYFNRYLPLMVHVLEKRFKARPNAQLLIDKLQERGIKVGVLSDYPMVRERVSAIGLNIDNKNMWSTENMGALKPSARPFLEVAKHLDIAPNEMLMIGDRPDTDGLGAYNAGCDCVIVQTKKCTNSADFNIMNWDDIVSSIS